MPIRALSSSSMTIFVCALLTGTTTGFVPAVNHRRAHRLHVSSMPSMEHSDQFFFTDDRTQPQQPQYKSVNSKTAPVTQPSSPDVVATKVASAAKISKKPAAGGAVHKEGVFSPIVQVSKMALGDERLNKLRAKIISLHSDIIANFVATSNTELGSAILQQLFELVDKDHSGTIDENELRTAFETLGFTWLQEKQVKGILERADTDTNGTIDMEEWKVEAPKTLRTNLIKLAKKNGGDMGLLV